MFRNVEIEGFRGLRHLELDGLARINLLVGSNNSGKTSVLESLFLLARVGDPNAIYQLMLRRGERLPDETDNGASTNEYDVCHMFFGHELGLGRRFSVQGRNSYTRREVSFAIDEVEDDEGSQLFSENTPLVPRTRLVLRIDGSPAPVFNAITLSPRGGLMPETMQTLRRAQKSSQADLLPSVYVTTESMTADGLVRLWNRLTLTPNEEFVLDALRYLEPDIERIAALAYSRPYLSSSNRGSFIVKMRNHEQPIPIGSMGDGMWRMLSLAIAVTQSRGGMLLVDEVDTGLHHSIMDGMWKMLSQASSQFDVQIFATTHSYDCVSSFARTQYYTNLSSQDFSVQRIEQGRRVAIPYSLREIRNAAEHGLEVR